MKQAFLLLFLALLSATGFSQYVYKIKADSVKITNDSCNAELILENSTRNVNGFLFNKANGRTEFRRGVIKVDDTTYIIGADTLKTGTGPAKFAGSDFFFSADSRATGNRAHSFKGFDLTIDSIKYLQQNADSALFMTRIGGFKYGTVNPNSVIAATLPGAFAGGYSNGGRIMATGRGSFAQGAQMLNATFTASNSAILASGSGTFAQGYSIKDGDSILASASGSFAQGIAYGGDILATAAGSRATGYAYNPSGALNAKLSASVSGVFVHGISAGTNSFMGNTGSTSAGAVVFGYTGDAATTTSNDTISAAGQMSFTAARAFIGSKVITSGYNARTFATSYYNSSVTNSGYGSTLFAVADTSTTVKNGGGGSFMSVFAQKGAYVENTGLSSFVGGWANNTDSIYNNSTASLVYGVGVRNYAGSTIGAFNKPIPYPSVLMGKYLFNTGKASYLFGSYLNNASDSTLKIGWGSDLLSVENNTANPNTVTIGGKMRYAAAPAIYSAGNYDVLVRNQTTGNVETVASSSLGGTPNSDSIAWKLTGNAAAAGSETGSFLGTTNNVSLRVRTNNTQRMIVDSTGNVGIATSAPSFTLDVAGSARVSTLPFSATSRDTLVSYNPVTKQLTGAMASGTLIGIRVLTSGTVYTPSTGTSAIAIELTGGGGGGGGTIATTNNNASCGAGGGSGAQVKKYISSLPLGPFTYSIGTGGSGGTTAGGNGDNGGSTSIVINGVTYTAPGGSGGSGSTSDAATALFVSGGSGASVGTNGDINGAGQPGDNGMRLSGTVVASGAGASSPYGGGGTSRTATSVGMTATAYGSGGSGAAAIGAVAGQTGGAGSAGVIIIYEYR
ncbi:glycine-rich domain-containing protein [Flavisolibacter nicotianae]|uniref:glycine-rich domain-containing protein n=1 Tax=Flavisolibacter nicotianae TaxID=2364882 RepID=UPI000EAC7B8F|nr:hypothetical protein [Flavisolibacter nicotianae]